MTLCILNSVINAILSAFTAKPVFICGRFVHLYYYIMSVKAVIYIVYCQLKHPFIGFEIYKLYAVMFAAGTPLGKDIVYVFVYHCGICKVYSF